MTKTLAAPALAQLLREKREVILDRTVENLRSQAGSHYQERAEGELHSWVSSSLADVVSSLEQGSAQPMMDRAETLSRERGAMGFAIYEVVEAILSLKEAALPSILQHFRTDPDAASLAILQLDRILRAAAGRFADLFANGMRQSVRQEKDRLALLLDAAETSGGSLDLDVILPSIARGIARALRLSHCAILLWNQREEVFEPRGSIAGSERPDLTRLLGRPLKEEADPLVSKALTSAALAAFCGDEAPAAFAERPDVEGIKTVVSIPIALAGEVLALAVGISFDRECEFDSDELRLVSGISQAVAPAVDNALKYEDAQHRLQEADRLQSSTEALLEMQNVDDVLAITAREAQRIVGAEGAVAFLHDGAEEPRRVASGNAASIAAEELAQRVAEPNASEISMPLEVKGRSVGTLLLTCGIEDCEEGDLRILRHFTESAGAAIVHARFHEQHERIAVLEDRQRLAHELHDSVTQSLYGVTMYSEAASRLLDADQADKAKGLMHDLQKAALEALREMRLLVFELRPPVLQKKGLAGALQARLAAVEGRAGVKTEFLTAGAISLPGAIEKALYGIAKESLNNILKHAEATRISVELRQSESSASLEISDNGLGFDTAVARQRGGLGLLGLEERATAIGGLLFIDSHPGSGTLIRVEVPLKNPPPETGGSPGAAS
jgi:signal transduction histidine kinase